MRFVPTQPCVPTKKEELVFFEDSGVICEQHELPWILLNLEKSWKHRSIIAANNLKKFYWNNFFKSFANQPFKSHSSYWFWFFRAKDFREQFKISWDPSFGQFDHLLFQLADLFHCANGINLKKLPSIQSVRYLGVCWYWIIAHSMV
jgi:hypothetical protein